jgi:putative ABC transport system ATP-binding protein
VGPSGSGKSTLLHCLAGILLPHSGTVSYRGREVSAMSDAERSALRRTDFGFVFQFGQLVPELTARGNVALPPRLAGARRREAERRAGEWLDRLGVGDMAGAPARSPGARASGSPSPARWPAVPASCSPTSPRARWTRWPANG